MSWQKWKEYRVRPKKGRSPWGVPADAKEAAASTVAYQPESAYLVGTDGGLLTVTRWIAWYHWGGMDGAGGRESEVLKEEEVVGGRRVGINANKFRGLN